ncbi:MAG: hypothetical protein LKI23_07240 [Bifidobacterium crudilactis]|jgi:hypothetical protein|nr:hypothetical protein [Bifidobacterium crudilactis]
MGRVDFRGVPVETALARVRLRTAVLLSLCWASFVLFVGFTLPSAGLVHPPAWIQVCQLVVFIVAVSLLLVTRAWNRQVGLALMDKLERDFDFAWYERYMDMAVAQARGERARRRLGVHTALAKARLRYIRGDFDGALVLLSGMNLQWLRRRGQRAVSTMACCVQGYMAALLAGRQGEMLAYYRLLTGFAAPNRHYREMKEHALLVLSQRAGVLAGVGSGAMSAVEFRRGPAPSTRFVQLENAYFSGLAEYARGNASHADELMRQVVELASANGEVYFVRKAQERIGSVGQRTGADAPVDMGVMPSTSAQSSDVRVLVLPEQRTGWNPMAVAGFILSLPLCVVGFVLSCIGLRQIGRHGGRGRGLAIAGVVVSLIAMVSVGSQVYSWSRDGCIPQYQSAAGVDPSSKPKDVERLLDASAYPEQRKLCTFINPHTPASVRAQGNTLQITYTFDGEPTVTSTLENTAARQLDDNTAAYVGEATFYMSLVTDPHVRIIVMYQTSTGTRVTERTYTPYKLAS